MTTTPFGTPILQAIAASREASAAHQPPAPAPCPLQPGDEVLLPQAVLTSIGARSDAWRRRHGQDVPVAVPVGNTGRVWRICRDRQIGTVMIEVAFPDREGSRTISVDVRLDRLERVESAELASD